MEKSARKNMILDKLSAANFPISGGELAAEFDVSRQVIVQDIALLRAEGNEIISTMQGYLLEQTRQEFTRVFAVNHTTDQIEDELCCMIDLGGYVSNVIVSHPVYGDIIANLDLSSRADVYHFVQKIKGNIASPLKNITNDRHSHTVVAGSEGILDSIEKALKEKGYLVLPE